MIRKTIIWNFITGQYESFVVDHYRPDEVGDWEGPDPPMSEMAIWEYDEAVHDLTEVPQPCMS